MPFGKGKHFLSGSGMLPKLLGNWTLSNNWNFQSGVPLGFSSPCNAVSCMPNLIGNPSAGRSGKSKAQREQQWFNPGAFEAPFGSDPTILKELSTGLNPDGTALNLNTVDQYWVFGNAAPLLGSGRSPGFWNADMSLSKKMNLTESRYIQFRWDLFNALNHQNLGIPNTNWCLPPNPDGSTDLIHQFGCQFGKITNVQTDPRSMQFGLRLQF
jgi:hypothetical protein